MVLLSVVLLVLTVIFALASVRSVSHRISLGMVAMVCFAGAFSSFLVAPKTTISDYAHWWDDKRASYQGSDFVVVIDQEGTPSILVMKDSDGSLIFFGANCDPVPPRKSGVFYCSTQVSRAY